MSLYFLVSSFEPICYKASVVLQRIVLITGFESFNADLYRKVAKLAEEEYPELKFGCLAIANITSSVVEVAAALQGADIVNGCIAKTF